MSQAKGKGLPPAIEARLAILSESTFREGDDDASRAVAAQFGKVNRDLHKAAKTIVAAWKAVPDADIGQTIRALDELNHVRTTVTTALLLPTAGVPKVKPMCVVSTE